jgi:hypothetical protein
MQKKLSLVAVRVRRNFPLAMRARALRVAELRVADRHARTERVSRAEGPIGDGAREGVLAEVVPWLHEREVAVYSGDCIERLPSGYELVRMPLHQVGMAAMGLAIVDCADCERLVDECRSLGRYTFCVVISPLRIPGGSASAVNPIALF